VIRLAAVVGAVAAEALAVYTVAEWLAANYAEGHQHAVAGWLFVLVALAGYPLPRLL
jgi:hypothetical protein